MPALNPDGSQAGGLTVRDRVEFFGVGTGFVVIGSTAEAPLCAIQNPTDSGVDIFVDIGEFSANQNTEFRRYISTTENPITLSSLGTAEKVRNLDGGTAACPFKLYKAGQFTPAGGEQGKVAFIAAYHTYFTELRGRLRVRPGRMGYWTIDGTGGGLRANVYFEVWQKPASSV